MNTHDELVKILESHVDTYGCDRMHINVIHPDSIPEIVSDIENLIRDDIARYYGIKEELFKAFGNFCKAINDEKVKT